MISQEAGNLEFSFKEPEKASGGGRRGRGCGAGGGVEGGGLFCSFLELKLFLLLSKGKVHYRLYISTKHLKMPCHSSLCYFVLSGYERCYVTSVGLITVQGDHNNGIFNLFKKP